MLVRLLPDDIENRWPVIKEALIKSIPSIIEKNNDSINRLLFALLDGTLHCWLSVEHKDGEPKIGAILTTTIVVDIPSGSKNLLIYSISAYEPLSQELISEGYKSLQEFAKSMKCFKIIAFTDIPRVIEMAKSIGGEATQTLIELEVNNAR